MRIRFSVGKIWVPAALILLIIGIVIPDMASYGQQPLWSVPEKISAKGMSSWFPDVAVDPSGTVHIVWSAGIIPYDLVYYMAIRQDKSRLEPIEIRAKINPGGGEASRPTLFTSPDGLLHMTYRDVSVFYSNVPDSLAHYFRDWKSDSRMGEGYFSRVAVDHNGKLHLLFTRNFPSGTCQICYHIYYRSSTDGGLTWSDEKDISGGVLGAGKPQILIEENDDLHVVWESGIGGSQGQMTDTDPTQVMYVSSSDGGNTWGIPLQLSPAEIVAKNITIGEDINRNLVVAWIDVADDTIYYQVSSNEGKSWSLPTAIPGVLGSWTQYHGRTDDYAMARDSAGNVHLVFSGRLPADATQFTPTPAPGNESAEPTPIPVKKSTLGPEKTRLSIIHLVWNGKSWSDPDVVYTFLGDVPEWPRIAVGLGNQLHLVWFTRAEKDIWKGGGDYNIWYTTRKVDAPLIAPIIFPAPTATVIQEAAQATPTPLITTTPEATIPYSGLTQKLGGKVVYQEMDYLRIAAISTLPVVFVVIVFILGVKKLRR